VAAGELEIARRRRSVARRFHQIGTGRRSSVADPARGLLLRRCRPYLRLRGPWVHHASSSHDHGAETRTQTSDGRLWQIHAVDSSPA
jgi:hypothetical protein